MAKSKNEAVLEARAVSDDAMAADAANWLRPGVWVGILTNDPIYYGLLVAITPSHYLLTHASWVADTGRQGEWVEDPQSAVEAEYLGDCAVERPVINVIRMGGVGKAIPTK